jgi:hypothetical protein
MTILELGTKFKNIFGFYPPIDMLLTYAKGPDKASIDIIRLDKVLAQHDPEYDDEKCTYKGVSGYSLKMYVIEKYGVDAAKFISNNL